ncbi:hypothetical protein TRFO_24502 [Tritrichomonas foetus]|uniref:Uncharacterized protein n=1 Tax=Tritrichomonas foetus TaxID=1144522 RepID=A0A1J4K7H9_9EUKA|nr:hypothetical protein TRFO_24502 [Tritrichomonas foetus]|eukprot:OHT07335.1 hypothetical protein TRFO_24502 [Tritrichomonas foetus]
MKGKTLKMKEKLDTLRERIVFTEYQYQYFHNFQKDLNRDSNDEASLQLLIHHKESNKLKDQINDLKTRVRKLEEIRDRYQRTNCEHEKEIEELKSKTENPTSMQIWNDKYELSEAKQREAPRKAYKALFYTNYIRVLENKLACYNRIL